MNDTKRILERLRDGELTVDQALLQLKIAPQDLIDFVGADIYPL